MYIDQIILTNFKVYKGRNVIDLTVQEGKNVSVIAGNNGFGKTSLLTSLVWCLYGKLMGDVDDRYRKEIYESGGYKSYCQKLLNRLVAFETNNREQTTISSNLFDIEPITSKSKIYFSVSIRFKKVFVPSIPCQSLQVTRTYYTENNSEALDILIDGQANELSKQVGNEIFINDYILKKEIAKFFFFDAEKIVELAEIRNLEERRMLSRAYGEVLGIKKYIDLKENLENMRLRLRKRNASGTDRDKLEKLSTQFERNSIYIEHLNTVLLKIEEELVIKRTASDKYQEQLIREGSSITLEELKDLRQMKENLQEENTKLKHRFNDMLELAPLAILSGKMESVKRQIETEKEQSNEALLRFCVKGQVF